MDIFGGGYADDGPFIRTKHNVTCWKFAKAALEVRPEADIRADHCDWGKRPHNRNGSIPDFELTEGNFRVIGEVETTDTLQSKSLKQIQGMRSSGYKPLLIMPVGERKAGERWLDKHRVKGITVVTPKQAKKVLREPTLFDRFGRQLRGGK